jgi:copper chaperone CopZ
MLWFSTALVAAFAFFPMYVGNLLPGAASRADARQADTLVVGVEGMTCGGCETSVEQALSSIPGVISATASFENARAVVVANHATIPSLSTIAGALGMVGYQLSPREGIEPADKPLIEGQWTAEVRFEDSTSVKMVVDLGRVGSRLAGEFDVLDWGVENYPVEVSLADTTIHLHFAGPNADFAGKLAGDRLIGLVTFRVQGTGQIEERELPLELQRVGGAQFSDTFLKLENAADDSALVQRLSPSGGELRDRFNADADKTRLLMLLSPT